MKNETEKEKKNYGLKLSAHIVFSWVWCEINVWSYRLCFL